MFRSRLSDLLLIAAGSLLSIEQQDRASFVCNPSAALQALRGADTRYDLTSSAGGLAPYRKGEVSLPKGQVAGCPLTDLLKGEKRC